MGFSRKSPHPSLFRATEFQGCLNFENSRVWEEKQWIPGVGESFDGILGEERKKKKQWKIPGGWEKFDWIPEGKVSENGYPQQGRGGYGLFLEKPNMLCAYIEFFIMFT